MVELLGTLFTVDCTVVVVGSMHFNKLFVISWPKHKNIWPLIFIWMQIYKIFFPSLQNS